MNLPRFHPHPSEFQRQASSEIANVAGHPPFSSSSLSSRRCSLSLKRGETCRDPRLCGLCSARAWSRIVGTPLPSPWPRPARPRGRELVVPISFAAWLAAVAGRILVGMKPQRHATQTRAQTPSSVVLGMFTSPSPPRALSRSSSPPVTVGHGSRAGLVPQCPRPQGCSWHEDHCWRHGKHGFCPNLTVEEPLKELAGTKKLHLAVIRIFKLRSLTLALRHLDNAVAEGPSEILTIPRLPARKASLKVAIPSSSSCRCDFLVPSLVLQVIARCLREEAWTSIARGGEA